MACGGPGADAQDHRDPPAQEERAGDEDPRFEAGFSRGLRLSSKEQDWDLHLGGRWLGHERLVFDHEENTDFRTRQALVRLDAEAWKHFEARIAGDFTPVKGVPSARFDELYLQWTPDPDFALTAGLAKMPTGEDKAMSLLYTEGIERPITATFQSSKEPGLIATGSAGEGFLMYNAAISDGRNEIVHPSNVDDSQLGLDEGTGRFSLKYYLSAALRPFAPSSDELLNGIRLGLFTAENFTSGVDVFDGFRIKSPDFGVLWLSPAGSERELFFQGRRILAGADPSWAVGPFLLRGEFLFRRDHVFRPSTGLETALDTFSWSAVTSWILTGERQSPGKRVPAGTPVSSGNGGIGRIDVHLRVSAAHVDKAALDALGTDFSRYTNRFTSYGTGASWWPESNVRISLELIREDYHQAIVINAAGDRERSLGGLLLRFQVDF